MQCATWIKYTTRARSCNFKLWVVFAEDIFAGPALATSQLATTDLQERSHQHGLDFIFPKPPFREKSVIQGSFQQSWFLKWPFLHYNQAEDTVFCHTCMKMFKKKKTSTKADPVSMNNLNVY